VLAAHSRSNLINRFTFLTNDPERGAMSYLGGRPVVSEMRGLVASAEGLGGGSWDSGSRAVDDDVVAPCAGVDPDQAVGVVPHG
jgi:hypothetical protein